MPSYGSTAEWIAAQCLKLDWQSRHAFLQRLAQNRPLHYQQTVRLLTSDQCLWGVSQPAVQEGCIFIMKDKKREDGMVQTTLHDYFTYTPR